MLRNVVIWRQSDLNIISHRKVHKEKNDALNSFVMNCILLFKTNAFILTPALKVLNLTTNP